MSRIISYAVLAIIAAAAVVYFTYGPSFILGGPKSADIIAVSRQAMIDSAPSEEARKQAADAQISPRGLCNNVASGAFACMVDVSVAGQPATTLVTVMKKGANGDWIAQD